MKKICLSRQTAGYLLRALRNSTHPSLPTLMSALATEQKERRCVACVTHKHTMIDLFKSLFDDVAMAIAKGEGDSLREFFNKVTNNDFTTRWEFVIGSERISL